MELLGQPSYINDLIIKINSLDIGIENDGGKVGILAYADDVVLFAENERELQLLMNELNIWYDNNRLEVNVFNDFFKIV